MAAVMTPGKLYQICRAKIVSEDWVALSVVCMDSLQEEFPQKSADWCSEIVEDCLQKVASFLRGEVQECLEDGVPPAFQIDEEASPYVRCKDAAARDLLGRMRNMHPANFENLCANMVSRIGRAESHVTRYSKDGGVDFYALDFDFVPDGVSTPQSCKAIVIGQAKRYSNENSVGEGELRSFIGGAFKVRSDLSLKGGIFPLSPTVYAFWTTGEFERPAKNYAKSMGIWYLAGPGLARYVLDLGLEGLVEVA